MSSVLDQIRELLTRHRCPYREVQHEPTLTSEASAAARGEPLGVGAKALLLKCDDSFHLLVIPADRKLDSPGAKRFLGARQVRFATTDELFQLTALVPGSVPPFGRPILPFELYADQTIGERDDKLAFNAGSLTNSIIMAASDWRQIAAPQLGPLSKSA